MGIIKKRIIKYSILLTLGLLLFFGEIMLIMLLVNHKLDFKIQLTLLVIIAALFLPSIFFPLIEITNLGVILKYYVVKEKHPRVKDPSTYNVLKYTGIVMTISSFVLTPIFAVVFTDVIYLFFICLALLVTGIFMYLTASYLRTLCFDDCEKQKMMKCPYCKNDIPTNAKYCIYCDTYVTDKKREKLNEIMDILDNNKTSLYK